MPQVSKFIDEVRAVFGEVKVLYAREGDYEVGKRELMMVAA